MKILLTGSSGQIGGALKESLAPLGTVLPLDRADLDLSDVAAIPAIVRRQRPDLIVHPAAYTAVDRAEQEPDLAYRINAEASGALAEAARELDIPIISYSTDYVFNGEGSHAHREDDPTGPINVYGLSKLAGERAIQDSGAQHLILRTAWVYGRTGKNFMLTMLKLAETRDEIAVVNDQVGTPSESQWIALVTSTLIARFVDHQAPHTRLTIPSGVIHLTPRGETSWADFARAIFEIRGLKTRVKDIPSQDYPTPAKRPRNSRLDISKLEHLLDSPVPDWRTILEDCLARDRADAPQ